MSSIDETIRLASARVAIDAFREGDITEWRGGKVMHRGGAWFDLDALLTTSSIRGAVEVLSRSGYVAWTLERGLEERAEGLESAIPTDADEKLKADEGAAINPKDLLGIKKPPVHLVPSAAVLHIATAFRRGAKKYGPYNWRQKRVLATVYVAAAMRHLQSYLDGEDYDFDPISNDHVHHLAAVGACVSIVLDAMEGGQLGDDRPPRGPASDLIRRLTEE